MTWHENFLQTPWCNAFQFKILWFRLVSVSAKGFGQFSVSVSVSDPKPKRWFRSCTISGWLCGQTVEKQQIYSKRKSSEKSEFVKKFVRKFVKKICQEICQKIRRNKLSKKPLSKKIVKGNRQKNRQKNSSNLKEPTPSNTKVTNSLDTGLPRRPILVLRSSACLASGRRP